MQTGSAAGCPAMFSLPESQWRTFKSRVPQGKCMASRGTVQSSPWCCGSFRWWCELLRANQPGCRGSCSAAAAGRIQPVPGQRAEVALKCVSPPQSPSRSNQEPESGPKEAGSAQGIPAGGSPTCRPAPGLWEAALRHRRLPFLRTFTGQASESGNRQGTEEGTFVNRQPCYVDLINMCSANSKQIPALPQAEFLQALPSKTLCHSCREA